jgi:hypothetical protein
VATLALPRFDAAPRRPDNFDEDAATTAIPVLAPRGGPAAPVPWNRPTQADADADERTVAMPERRPRADEATVADGDLFKRDHDMSARPGARAVESTFVLTDAADVDRAAPRPDEATLAMSGAQPALGRPGPGESTAGLPGLTNMTQGARQPQAPPEEASLVSPRGLIAVNVVLGALILAALVVLLAR